MTDFYTGDILVKDRFRLANGKEVTVVQIDGEGDPAGVKIIFADVNDAEGRTNPVTALEFRGMIEEYVPPPEEPKEPGRVDPPEEFLAYPEHLPDWTEAQLVTFRAWMDSLDMSAVMYTSHMGLIDAWRHVLEVMDRESAIPIDLPTVRTWLAAQDREPMTDKVFTGAVVALYEARETRNFTFDYDVVLGLMLRLADTQRDLMRLEERASKARDILAGIV